MKISKSVINSVLVAAATLVMSGCSMVQSVAEVPSLESQTNRIVVGMGLVRENTAIANMPLSADATWPEELTRDMTDENRIIIDEALARDPYVATHMYTDAYQKAVLGGVAFLPVPKVNNITYTALNRAIALYGPDPVNWPTFFELSTDLSTFHEFQNGNLKRVEATTGNAYPNVTEAVISLMPTNFQKDLRNSKQEMIDGYKEVAQAKSEKAALENTLEEQKGAGTEGSDIKVLSEEEKLDITNKIAALETEIAAKETAADEKETIYLTQLDEAMEALKSDIELDDEQVKLAKNIILVSAAIKDGAIEAGIGFTTSVGIIAGHPVIGNFTKELETLAVAKMYIPEPDQAIYDKRIARVGKNAIYALPALAIGSYYAIKQAVLAEKYETVAEIVVEADELRKAEAAALKEAEEAAAAEKVASETTEEAPATESSAS